MTQASTRTMSQSLLSAFLGKSETSFVEVPVLPTSGARTAVSIPLDAQQTSVTPPPSTKEADAQTAQGPVASLAHQWLLELKTLFSALVADTSPVSARAAPVAVQPSLPRTEEHIAVDALPVLANTAGPVSAVASSHSTLSGLHEDGGESPSPVPDPLGRSVSPNTAGTLGAVSVPLRTHESGSHAHRYALASPTPVENQVASVGRGTLAVASASGGATRSSTPVSANSPSVSGSLDGTSVAVVRGVCYRRVVSPMLIVFDLDHTILSVHLSHLLLTDTDPSHSSESRRLAADGYFVDAPFFAWFCEQAHRMGHLLAIASLTDGAADRGSFGASAAESVLYILDRVLPPNRSYLCVPEDIVCQCAAPRALKKQAHLVELQRRLNATWQHSLQRLQDDGPDGPTSTPAEPTSPFSPHHTPRGLFSSPMTSRSAEERKSSNSVLRSTHPSGDLAGLTPMPDRSGVSFEGGDSTAHSIPRTPTSYLSPRPAVTVPPPAERVLPSWLSTDIVLIDDSPSNCSAADHAGFHAACCGESGFTQQWFAQNEKLRAMLGFC